MNIPQIVVAKSLVANLTAQGGSATAFSTLGRLKIDNRSSKDFIAASNTSGGVDRPLGVRELQGYAWDYGDVPPLNSNTSLPLKPNDLVDLAFTLDGSTAVQIASTSPSGLGVRIRALEVVVNPYTENKENTVYYVVHIGGAGNDFSATGSVPTDGTTPKILSTKSLGVQFAYWNGSALVWAPQCYYAGMHLKIEALADADWSSCLKGVAYFPSGNIDWSLSLGKRTNVWPIPTDPAVVPPMLSGQAVPSIPNANPGSVNATGAGDLVFPDLDAVVGVRMVTQVNSDLTPNAWWQLLYGMMSQKSGEFDHKSRKPMTVEYVLEKCSSMPSKASWDTGSIIYKSGIASDGSGGTSYQLWP